jgi:hypothetical protein
MVPLRIIDDESNFLDRTFPLQAALQRWENEGGAGPGRLPTHDVARDALPDLAMRPSAGTIASIKRCAGDSSLLL